MRIIQDSEDEDELEVEDVEAAAPERDAQPNQNSNNTSPNACQNGTGSTESLRRAIVAAHHAQFQEVSSHSHDQSNPSGLPSAGDPPAQHDSQNAPDSSVSLPGHVSKRRKTSLDGAVALLSARDASPVTYGTRHIGEATENINVHLSATPGGAFDFQGTMRENWEQHEPMALFPHSASSTIPNATATQQKLLAEVLAPDFLGVDFEPERDETPYQPAKSSVPWSEYLKSSVRGSQVLHQSAEPPLSFSPNNLSEPTQNSSERLVLEEVTNQARAPIILSPLRPVVEPLSDDELSTSRLRPQGSSNPPTVSPRNSKKQKLGSVPKSEDDLLAIGLPKEQYKPRPSRSRSLKLSGEDSIDYSRRPEQVAKKSRRSRTSGEVETATIVTTPAKVRQICDMGFTPSTTKRALRQHNGDVTHTVDWLISNGVATEDVPAPTESSNSKSKKKGKRDAITQNHSAETQQDSAAEIVKEPDHVTIYDHVPESVPMTGVTRSPTVVKVVIPSKKRPVTPSKREEPQAVSPDPLQQTTRDVVKEFYNPEEAILPFDEQFMEQPIATNEAPKGKKRGRGRPKKEAKAMAPPEEERCEETVQEPSKIVLEEPFKNQSNKPDEFLPAVNGLAEAQTKYVTDEASRSEPTNTTPEPAPPPGKKAKSMTDAPSSISKGKTPYRVGLSKRARIAPLLRIVKK